MSEEPETVDRVGAEIEASLDSAQRQLIRRCLFTLGVLGSASMLGSTFFLVLVNHYPLLLIALSPIGRHLILVAPIANPVAFVAVAVFRRMAFYVPSFLLGRALGPYGIVWLEQRAARLGRFFRWLERLFGRAPRTVVFLMPGPGVATIAGASGMAARSYVLLVAAGLVVRMIVLIAIADWAREPLEAVLAWIERNRLPGTIAIVIGVAIYQLRKRRRRSSTGH